MPGDDLAIVRLLGEEAGAPQQDVRTEDALDRVEDFRTADEVGEPGKEDMDLLVVRRG